MPPSANKGGRYRSVDAAASDDRAQPPLTHNPLRRASASSPGRAGAPCKSATSHTDGPATDPAERWQPARRGSPPRAAPPPPAAGTTRRKSADEKRARHRGRQWWSAGRCWRSSCTGRGPQWWCIRCSGASWTEPKPPRRGRRAASAPVVDARPAPPNSPQGPASRGARARGPESEHPQRRWACG